MPHFTPCACIDSRNSADTGDTLASPSSTSMISSARILTYLAETTLWAGETEQAAQWLAKALTYHANPTWIRTELVDCLWTAARLAAVQQNYLRAATLSGLAEQVSSRIRYVLVEPVRGELEPAVFAEAFAAGRQMSLNEAFALSFINLLRDAELSR